MRDSHTVQDRDQYLQGRVPRPGAHSRQRAVHAPRPTFDRHQGVRDAQRQVMVSVHPPPGFRLECVVERTEPFRHFVHEQGAGGIDHIHTVSSVGFHESGLPRKLSGRRHVRHHEEARYVHPQRAGEFHLLAGDVRLGAVRGDPRDGRADVARVPQVVDRTQPGQQEYRDPCGTGLVDRRGDEVELVDPGEAVVEARPAQAVAVSDLDHLDVAAVQRVHDGAYLLLGELVRERVRPVPQRRVGEPDPDGYRARGRHGAASAAAVARAAAPAARGRAARCAASSSATRVAAAVMMSRLPA